jgi:hypothetical protein
MGHRRSAVVRRPTRLRIFRDRLPAEDEWRISRLAFLSRPERFRRGGSFRVAGGLGRIRGQSVVLICRSCVCL